MTSPITGESINAPNDGSYFRREKKHRRRSRSRSGSSEQLQSYDPHVHKRRRRPGDSDSRQYRSNLVFVASMVAVLLTYLVILGVSLLWKKHRPAQKASTPPAAAAAVTATAPGEQTASLISAEYMKERIRSWERATDMVHDGEQLTAQRSLARAETRLKQAAQINPENLNLHRALAKLYQMEEKLPEAEAELLEVLERSPENQETRLALAQVFSQRGNHPAALVCAEWVLEKEPFSIEANRIVAAAHLNLQNPGLAIPPLRKITHITPEDINARNNLAVAHCRIGQYDKALTVLEAIRRENAADSVTLYNLAVCYAQTGEAGMALQAIREASARFGENYVKTWLGSADFDPIRKTPGFQSLLGNTGGETMQEKAADPATQPAVEKENESA